MLHRAAYPLACSKQLLSPCLLLYRQQLEHNLAEMLRIAHGDPLRLRPHAKTHKCGEVVRLETQHGIVKHKCATLQEACMLAEHGASDVLLAYPLVGPSVYALIDLTFRFPQTQFAVVVDNELAVRALAQVVAEHALSKHTHANRSDDGNAPTGRLRVFIDIDSGMHRTGIQPGAAALGVAQAIQHSDGLQLAGLHLYDGQNHQSSLTERQQAVQELIKPVWDFIRQVNQLGLTIDTLVCGGTPTFPVFAKLERPDDLLKCNKLFVELSPGTCVLHDFNYGRDYGDMPGFRAAAVLLCRVVSKPGVDLLTVDLGYKAVAPDSPASRRAYFLDLPEAEQIQHSEEHLVLRTSKAQHIPLGACLLAVPAHVCPTVALYSDFHVINEQGELAAKWPISRNRMLAPVSMT
jgi:D-threonine aldolase